MKLNPKDVSQLRDIVTEMDRLESLIGQTMDGIDKASASIGRLNATMADIRQAEAEHATKGLAPDAARLAAIMAGESPTLLDQDVIAARAEQSLIAQAHIQQLSQDVAAIERHRNNQNAVLTDLRRQKDAATGKFLEQFSAAGMAAYREAAIALVEEHMPAMEAVASAIILRNPAHEWPSWWGTLAQGLRIILHEGTPPHVKTIGVWPRGDMRTLEGGTPLLGADGIPALIDAVRQGKQEL